MTPYDVTGNIWQALPLGRHTAAVVRQLLSSEPAARLGGPAGGGAHRLMKHPFFDTVDWGKDECNALN